jgi:predicted hydrolase (HD superfamily)
MNREPLTRAEAWELLCAWTHGESLRRHALAVEAVMRNTAARHGAGAADVERYGLAGLLHDADYEAWPQQHPARIVAWLVERGEPELAAAVASHYTGWGVPQATPLARALLACDELSGFVVACARVRPDGFATLEPRSVLKRLKDAGFAAGVERAEVQAGADALGVALDEHIRCVIEALRAHPELLAR